MRLLLDTHVLLWWLGDDPALGDAAADAVADGRNTAIVSAASVWEVEIKRAKGALAAPGDLLDQVASAGFELLPISAEHARDAGRLPRHHDDPFDRMLVAQALAEDATLVTGDAAIPPYGVAVLSAA